MRIISFEQDWPKLHRTRFTTFRFPRRDRDWEPGELVKVVVKARTAERLYLGIAKISIMVTNRIFPCLIGTFPGTNVPITTQEAIEDGFWTMVDMNDHFVGMHGKRLLQEPLNKLVLMYTERYEG